MPGFGLLRYPGNTPDSSHRPKRPIPQGFYERGRVMSKHMPDSLSPDLAAGFFSIQIVKDSIQIVKDSADGPSSASSHP
jgi:hypothetical protein